MKFPFFDRAWLQDRTPPGLDLSTYLMKLKVMLTLSFLMAQYGWFIFFQCREVRYSNGHLLPGYQKPTFSELLTTHSSFILFLAFGVVLLGMVYWMLSFYRSFYRDSRSIYTMKRLPDRWALLRRCVTLPFIGVCCTLLLTALTVVLFWVGYCLLFP